MFESRFLSLLNFPFFVIGAVLSLLGELLVFHECLYEEMLEIAICEIRYILTGDCD